MKSFVCGLGLLAAVAGGGCKGTEAETGKGADARAAGNERPWPRTATRERQFLDGLTQRFVDAEALDIQGAIVRTTPVGKDGAPGVAYGSAEARVLRPLRGFVRKNVEGAASEQLGDGKAIYYLNHDRQTYRRTGMRTWRAALPEMYLCRVWCDANHVGEGILDVRMEEDNDVTRLVLRLADHTETLELDRRQRIVSANIEWNDGAAARFDFSRFDLVRKPDPSRYRSAIPESYRAADAEPQ